ncbi:MAG: hypothetical protein J7527_12125, partial [Chitinophagaceae bacterium]|nr:hypothetical protein [Chitinophagaceae bacterium]
RINRLFKEFSMIVIPNLRNLREPYASVKIWVTISQKGETWSSLIDRISHVIEFNIRYMMLLQ